MVLAKGTNIRGLTGQDDWEVLAPKKVV